WAQHVAFLDDTATQRAIRRSVAETVRSLASHDAILGFSIGNEIPASVVRWHGAHPTERFLHDLYDAAKGASPESLVTYVNFPPTAFLDLSFLDFCAFNVFLHDERDLGAYLCRLQNIAGQRPLVLTEVGIDSIREGAETQARMVDASLRTAYGAGCAGAF